MVVSFIFVSQQGILHEIVDNVIELVTHSKYAHIAIGFEDCIIEAVFPRVIISPIDEFVGETQREIISFTVADEMYQAMRDVAQAQVCKLYGIDDCIIGGLHDLSDIELSALNITNTEDCSSLCTIVARVLFPGLLLDIPICEVTPERFYEALKLQLQGG